MKESIRQLRQIRDLRRHLLPSRLPPSPGWRLAVRHVAAPWAGSDFYDVQSLPDGRLLVLLAGGSDQGAPATTLAAMLRVVLHSCPLSAGKDRLPFCPVQQPALQPPHVLLGHVNQILAENSLTEQFLTAFCAHIGPASGAVLYANAGHLPPRLWRAATRAVEKLPGPAELPLGLRAGSAYHDGRMELAPGDLLLLASEEIIAARSPWGEAFGDGPLEEALALTASQGPEAATDAIMSHLAQFMGRRRPAGDVTLLALQRLAEAGNIPLL